MPTIFMPAHITVLVRPGVGVQCGIMPHHAIILPLPPGIAAGHVAQVLGLARQPMRSAELAQGLTHCGFTDALAQEIVAELMNARILLPHLRNSSPIYLLDTGVAAAHTSTALERVGIPHRLTDEPTRAGSSVLLTGGEIFLPADVQYSLMTHRVPHFSHGIVDGRVILGPMVVPGITPCLSCVDSLYSTMDKGWRAMRIQAGAKPGARDRYELDAAGMAVAMLVRDSIMPWQREHQANITAPPAALLQRRIIHLGTFDTVTEDSPERFHAHCPVCDSARLHRNVRPATPQGLAVVGHNS